LLLSAIPARAQFTQVSATVTDPNGAPFANGTFTAQFYDPGTSGQLPLINGSTFQKVMAGSLTSFGSFTVTLADNNYVATSSGATGTQWRFTICSQPYTTLGGRTYCTTVYQTTITGASMDISAGIDANAPTLPSTNGTYVYVGPLSGIPATCTVSQLSFITDAAAGQNVYLCTTTNTWTQQSGGGGGGNPAGNVGDLQTKATSTTFGASHINDSNGAMIASESLSIAGPHPFVDVNAYGADPTGTTDSTTAIQTAITASCANSTHPTILFSGHYKVSQPQTPSTSPVFTICNALTLMGLSDPTADQFAFAPQSRIVVSAGSSPNTAPVFDFGNENTLKNIEVDGYNQAVKADGAFISIDGSCLSSAVTGQSLNSPLVIDGNSIWIWVEKHSCLDSNSVSVPDMIFNSNDPSGAMGLYYIQDVLMSGGGVEWLATDDTTSGVAGTMEFSRIQQENCGSSSFLSFTGSAPTVIGPITMDQVGQADCSGGYLVNYDAGGSISGLTINQSLGGSGAVDMQTGSISDFKASQGSGLIVGNGGVARTNSNGWDYYVPTTAANRLLNVRSTGDSGAPLLRGFSTSSSYASLALDPTYGLLLGDGASYGYNAGIDETTQGDADVSFAGNLPPTGLTATATTGGTLAAGTYYIWVRTVKSGAQCASAAGNDVSAFSQAASVVLSGSNDAIATSWTAPLFAPYSTPHYCEVWANTAVVTGNDGVNYANVAISSTSFTLTGSNTTCCGYSSSHPNVAYMYSAHRFTPDALGINTLTPQYDLDVAHTLAANSGIRSTAITLTANQGLLEPLSTPGSSSSTCTAGQIWADASYVYVCTATNTIERAALSTF
jgi:hypothetical protein